MSFKIPTLKEIHTQLSTDMESRIGGVDTALRRSVLGVLSRAFAAAVSGLYGFLNWGYRQRFVDTADTDQLERHGAVYGILRKPATFASGFVTFVGADYSVIPAGTELQRADGVIYTVGSEVAIVGGSVVTTVFCEAAGVDGNVAGGQTLEMISPALGVNSEAVVAAAAIVGGSEAESDDSLRARILARIQQPPHGGASQDYEAWVLDQATHKIATSRVWVSPLEMGSGTVTLRFMMDDVYADGIPQEPDVTAIAEYVEQVRPVTAQVFVVAPVAAPVSFDISGLSPATQAVKNAVIAELKDLIRREASPSGTLLVSHIREAISIAAGEHDHALVSPTANVVASVGEISTFGDVTWS